MGAQTSGLEAPTTDSVRVTLHQPRKILQYRSHRPLRFTRAHGGGALTKTEKWLNAEAVNNVLLRSRHRGAELLVLIAIAKHVNRFHPDDENCAHPAITTIAKLARLSVPSGPADHT